MYQMRFMPTLSYVMEVVEQELVESIDRSPPSLNSVHRVLGSRPRSQLSVTREWSDLVVRLQRMSHAVSDLVDAMDNASEYGYTWQPRGWYEDDAPYVGDDTTTRYLQPYVREFAESFVSKCVFMTREGQRSQHVHHDELDGFTGRTRVQEVVARRKRIDRKRRRENDMARIAMEEETRRQRREALASRIREAQDEIASLV